MSDQDSTRPSAFVEDVAMVVVVGVGVSFVEEEDDDGDMARDREVILERVTGMEEAGRPRVVSRTWQVIGGLAVGVDILVGSLSFCDSPSFALG